MKNYKDRQLKKKVYKILYIIGILLIVCTFLLSKKNAETIVTFACFFCGVAFMIPDYYGFFIEQRTRKLAGYWLVQFLTLPFLLLILIIFFVFKLINQ